MKTYLYKNFPPKSPNVLIHYGRPVWRTWTGPVWICVFYTLSEAKSKFVPYGTTFFGHPKHWKCYFLRIVITRVYLDDFLDTTPEGVYMV